MTGKCRSSRDDRGRNLFRWRVVAIPMLILAFGSTPVWAYISLGMEVRLEVAASSLNAYIRVTNSGNEAAHQLQAVLRDKKGVTNLPTRESLAAGASMEETARLTLPELLPGSHPLFLTLVYQDANGYPFSAVLCPLFQVGNAPPSEVLGTLEGMTMDEVVELVGRIKSVAQQPVRLEVNVHIPREFSVGEYPKQLILGTAEERLLAIQLRNFSALSGSTYPVYVTLEYESAGFHHTAVLTAPVEVMRQTWVGRNRWPLSAAAGLFLLLGLGFLIVRRPASGRTRHR